MSGKITPKHEEHVYDIDHSLVTKNKPPLFKKTSAFKQLEDTINKSPILEPLTESINEANFLFNKILSRLSTHQTRFWSIYQFS